MKKHLLAPLFLVFSTLSCSKQEDPQVDPSVNPIEVKYTAAGPYAVSSTTVRNSSGRDLYIIYYPTQLPAGCPVVTWGNGTGQDYTAYRKPLQHLASWGYIVIDNYDGDTAPGGAIVASAQYMVEENSNPASMFYRKVDVDHIAAVGHSQGGVGVVNARTKANGRMIKTIVPLHMSPNIAGSGLSYNTADVDVPIFFISGTKDGLFSPLRVSQAAYNAVPRGVPAVLGIRLGAFHDAIRDTDKEQGYVTAWLEYQLKGNQDAAKAFRGSSAEMQENPLWGNVGRKNL